jgi:hypothetical protein
LKISIILAFAMLAGCSWFHRKAPPAPEPPQLIVTGAPAGSIVFIDDVQKGLLTELNDKPQIVVVSAGEHKLEVRRDGIVVYREDVYVKGGQKQVVTVLSGSNRE